MSTTREDVMNTKLGRKGALATRLARACAMALVALIGCSSSTPADRAKGRDAATPIDAAPVDAPPVKRTSMGPFSRMEERFDRECPPTLPRYETKTGLGRSDSSSGIVCAVRSPTTRPGKPAQLTKRYLLTYREHGSHTPEIRSFALSLDWRHTADGVRPAQCDELLDEAVTYFRAMTGIDEDTALKLRTGLLRDDGTRNTWWRVALQDDLDVAFVVRPGTSGTACSVELEMDVSASMHRNTPVTRMDLNDVTGSVGP